MNPVDSKRRELEEWIKQSVNSSTALSFVPLKGATSTTVYQVCTSSEESYVLRLFTNSDWLQEEPDLAEHEAAVLKKAYQSKLPVPELIAYTSGKVAFGIPAVLMSYVEGVVKLKPEDFIGWLKQLAVALAQVHTIDAQDIKWAYRSWTTINEGPAPGWLNQPDLWPHLLTIANSDQPLTDQVFIHRDYQPVNVLWQKDKLVSIVDWVNGCRGSASVDIAHCRLNLALMYGLKAADDFLDAYTTEVSHFNHHPYWDVDAALSWLPDLSYYEPWREFGLGDENQAVLQSRMDVFLQAAANRI